MVADTCPGKPETSLAVAPPKDVEGAIRSPYFVAKDRNTKTSDVLVSKVASPLIKLAQLGHPQVPPRLYYERPTELN